MSTSPPLPGPLPDRVWWGTDASPITQAWECPPHASAPPPAVPAHTAEGWKRAARPPACAPVSAAAPPQRLQRGKSFCISLFKQLASRWQQAPPSQQPPRRRLPVTRPPSGLCRQGGPAVGASVRRGRAPGSAGRHWRAAGRHRRVSREKWSRGHWFSWMGTVLPFETIHLYHLHLENFLHRQPPLKDAQGDSGNFSSGKMDPQEIMYHPVHP